MKDAIHITATFVALIAFAVLWVYVPYTRWTNPDMTETRLFLTFWREYIGLSVLFIVSAWTSRATRN